MDPSGTWNLPSNPSWTLDIKNKRPPSRPAWHPSPSIISGVSLLPSPQVDPPRDRGSTQKQRSRRTKTLQADRAKARKFKGLLSSNKTPWGLGGSSCNWFQDIVKGFDAVKRFCLSMEFLKILASNSKVYWSFVLGRQFIPKESK